MWARSGAAQCWSAEESFFTTASRQKLVHGVGKIRLYWGCIGIMEQKMETAIICRVIILGSQDMVVGLTSTGRPKLSGGKGTAL